MPNDLERPIVIDDWQQRIVPLWQEDSGDRSGAFDAGVIMVTRRRRRRRVNGEAVATHVQGERLYKLSKVADEASVSKRTLENHVRKGLVKVRRVGPHGALRIPESERMKYLGLDKDES